MWNIYSTIIDVHGNIVTVVMVFIIWGGGRGREELSMVICVILVFHKLDENRITCGVYVDAESIMQLILLRYKQ